MSKIRNIFIRTRQSGRSKSMRATWVLVHLGPVLFLSFARTLIQTLVSLCVPTLAFALACPFAWNILPPGYWLPCFFQGLCSNSTFSIKPALILLFKIVSLPSVPALLIPVTQLNIFFFHSIYHVLTWISSSSSSISLKQQRFSSVSFSVYFRHLEECLACIRCSINKCLTGWMNEFQYTAWGYWTLRLEVANIWKWWEYRWMICGRDIDQLPALQFCLQLDLYLPNKHKYM